MANDLGLKIDGVDKLLDVMDAIEKDMESANIEAVRAGLKQFIRGARSRIKSSTTGKKGKKIHQSHPPGNLKKSIKGKILKPKNPDFVVGIVGPEVGKKAKHDGFYGPFVEKGHRNVKVIGQHADRRYKKRIVMVNTLEYGGSDTPPHEFMRPTQDEDKGKIDKAMAEKYYQALERKSRKGKTVTAIDNIIEGD